MVKRKAIIFGVMLALSVLFGGVFGHNAFAADYTLTIDNSSVTKNQDVIFAYQNVGPNFLADAPIDIVNNATSAAQISLISVTPDPTDPNQMLAHVNLALLRGSTTIVQGSISDLANLVGADYCVPANSTGQLTARFHLPPNVGNVAQNSSMKVIYTFRVTVGNDACEIVTPPGPGEPGPPDTSSPNVLPPTGETMWAFWVLGGVALLGLAAVLIFALIILVGKKRRSRPSAQKKTLATDDEIGDFEINEGAALFKPKKSRKKRVAMIIADVFFALCLLTLAAAVGVTAMAKKSGQAVEIAGYRPFMIATGSMQPTFQIDGLVFTHNDSFDSVKVGDVVAFKAAGLKGQPALHRVISIDGSGESKQFIVQGDNNPHPDGAPVTRDNYIGRAVWNTNLTATFFNELHAPGGFWRVIVLPLAILILLYLAIRWLVGSSAGWRGKGLAIAAVILMLGASCFFSYYLYTSKQTDYTNAVLGKVAKQFADSGPDMNWKIEGKAVIGRIEIPKIQLDYPIIKYVSATSLNISITHFAGADINAVGNDVLAGHRTFGVSSPFYIFFTKIDTLQKGDEIYLTSPDRKRIKYLVESYETVAPSDTSVLDQPNDSKKHLTLISCTYNLRNRYIVHAVAE